MSEPSMVEKVARALETKISGKEFVSFEDAARAAIEAMREPTDAMVDAMNDVNIDGPAYVAMNPSMADCAALFTAGIDAALNESA